jgi:hypothetical protein
VPRKHTLTFEGETIKSKKQIFRQGMVAHTYKPRYSGAKRKEDHNQRLTRTKAQDSI